MRRFAILAAVLVMAAACQNDSTGPSGQLTGTYQLQMINGQRLPFTFTNSNNGDVEQLNSDQLTIFSDGSYQDVANITDNTGTYQSVENGNYVSNNGAITFYDNTDGVQYGGSLSGSVLTEISNNGTLTEVFQRQ